MTVLVVVIAQEGSNLHGRFYSDPKLAFWLFGF
jgi:hypothetical protein